MSFTNADRPPRGETISTCLRAGHLSFDGLLHESDGLSPSVMSRLPTSSYPSAGAEPGPCRCRSTGRRALDFHDGLLCEVTGLYRMALHVDDVVLVEDAHRFRQLRVGCGSVSTTPPASTVLPYPPRAPPISADSFARAPAGGRASPASHLAHDADVGDGETGVLEVSPCGFACSAVSNKVRLFVAHWSLLLCNYHRDATVHRAARVRSSCRPQDSLRRIPPPSDGRRPRPCSPVGT